MSIDYNPRIITDNLVLYMDTDNTKKGFNIENNLAPYSNYSNRNYDTLYDIGGWGGDDADVYYYSSGGYNNLPYKKMIKHTGGTGGSFIDEHTQFTLESNTNYLVSCWMKSNINGTSVSPLCICVNKSDTNSYFSPPSNLTLSDTWEWKSWVFNVGANGSSTYVGRHIVYNDTGLPVEIYWSDFQVRKITIKDIVQNISLAAPSNGITIGSDLKISSFFEGVNDYLYTPTLSNQFLKTGMTVSVALKYNQLTSNDNLLSWGIGAFNAFNGTQYAFELRIRGSGQVEFSPGIGPGGSGVPIRLSYQPSPALYARDVVIDVSYEANGTASIYENGVLKNSYNYSGVGTSLTTNPLWIGRGTDGYFPGNIYQVKLYDRALTQSEIKQNFNAIRGRYGI